MSDEERYVGLFAYGTEPVEETDWDSDAETTILGEENDLPATWQVQLNLATGSSDDVEYLDENNPEYEGTTQARLDPEVRAGQTTFDNYSNTPTPASD